MIRNQRQYNVTKGQVVKLESALDLSEKTRAKMDRRVHKAMVAGLKSQIQDLQNELEEYEELKQATTFHLSSPDELPQVLIKARVAKGYSQKDLAEKLNLKPQQIQKYEATEYSSASLNRILSVMDALELELDGEVHL